MNKNLPLMLIFYVGSLMGMMSTFNWFIFWIFLELNTLTFLPLMLAKKTKKSGEATLLYFIVQSISSMYLLVAMMSESNSSDTWYTPNHTITIMAFLKMSAGIFFGWAYLLSFILNTTILMVILTLQKIAPFFLVLMAQETFSMFFLIFIIVSTIMAVFSNLKQNNFKPLITISSLSNMSWLLAAAALSVSVWFFYFSVYCFSLFVSMSLNMHTLNQNYKMNNQIENPLLFLSLSGLPPMPGFFPKVIILKSSAQESMIGLSMFLLLMTCVDIFIYLRFSYGSSLLTKSNTIMSSILYTTPTLLLLSLVSIFLLFFSLLY